MDEKQYALDVAFNLYVSWFRKSFWLLLMVRFCHLSQEEDRFSLLSVDGTWRSVHYLWLIGAGTVTSPPSAEAIFSDKIWQKKERDAKVGL